PENQTNSAPYPVSNNHSIKTRKGVPMARALLLAFTILLSAAWLQAQTSQSSTGQSGSSSSSASGQQTTVQGCLQGSAGSYTLTSDSGTSYQLQGDTSKLSDHVGHEVAITGTPSASSSATAPSSGTSSSSASGSSSSQNTLNVDSVKHISATCSKSGK